MSEQTEKTNPSPRKAPAAKRPPRKTRAAGSGSKTAARKKAGQDKPVAGDAPNKASSAKTDAAPKAGNALKAESKGSGSGALAPDPATVTFGSNKPIVAAPPPKPASSGLRFSGPSAGTLKASGPQTTSPKADGLTFTSAGTSAGTSTATDARSAKGDKTQTARGNGSAKPSGANRLAEDASRPKAADPKVAPAKSADKKTGPETSAKAKAKPGQQTPDAAKAKDGKAKDPKAAKEKAPQKQPGIGKPGVTKPAIAPQNSGPLIEKTPSRRPATLALLGFGCAVAGLAWWLGNQQPPQPRVAANDSTAVAGTSDSATPIPQNEAPAAPAPAEPQPQSPAAADSSPAVETPPVAIAGSNSVTVAELWEIQDLLRQLDLGPGASSGQMTAATREAIRSYQAMAGLPVDGEASPALLEELRAVAALYSGG